jgi:serine/threonine protein kinase
MSRQADPFRTVQEQEGQPIVPAAQAPADEHPPPIGRYCVERLRGEGGFGRVYLPKDDQLGRPVAITVPHPHLVAGAGDAAAYLTEARTVASLDHPHIGPVYDVGSTAAFPCHVAPKYIDGTDLATRLKRSRLTIHEAVELVATVAEGTGRTGGLLVRRG